MFFFFFSNGCKTKSDIIPSVGKLCYTIIRHIEMYVAYKLTGDVMSSFYFLNENW